MLFHSAILLLYCEAENLPWSESMHLPFKPYWIGCHTELITVLLHRCHSWDDNKKSNKDMITELSRELVHDAARKAEAVWLYRKVFTSYPSFALGERIYVVRARFASMLRTYLRNQMRIKVYDLDTLLRNALILQSRTQSIYILNDELVEFDLSLTYEGNPLNWTRFEKNNCHVAGPPCERVPTKDGYFRRSAMDQALQVIENRRKFIRQKYRPKINKPPIDINAELNRSLNFKYTTSSGHTILLEGHETWIGSQKDKDLLTDMGRTLVYDSVRRAETVWGLKDDFGKYKTFGIGEKIYLIRTKMSQMLRLSMRSQSMYKTRTTTQMVQNLTNLQRMCQELFLFMEELVKYDSEIMSQDKIINVSRIAIGESCQAAGSMAIPASLMDKYRRQVVDARRQHIINTYLQRPLKRPIDVGKEVSESLNIKRTRAPIIQDQDADFMDLAPDFM